MSSTRITSPIGKLPLDSVGSGDLDAAWMGGQALSIPATLTAEATRVAFAPCAHAPRHLGQRVVVMKGGRDLPLAMMMNWRQGAVCQPRS